MLFLLSGLALADPTILTASGAGGLDYTTANPWSGVELAAPATQLSGADFQGRLSAGWAFLDKTPLVLSEAGASFVIPEDEATVRVGILGRLGFISTDYPLPVQPGTRPAPGRRSFGVVPGVMGTVEFEWIPDAPLTLGIKGGVGSSASGSECLEDQDLSYCVTWDPAFIGGFVGRKRWKNGLTVELVAGPTASLSVGYSFPVGKN